jgi:hypothetical protein
MATVLNLVAQCKVALPTPVPWVNQVGTVHTRITMTTRQDKPVVGIKNQVVDTVVATTTNTRTSTIPNNTGDTVDPRRTVWGTMVITLVNVVVTVCKARTCSNKTKDNKTVAAAATREEDVTSNTVAAAAVDRWISNLIMVAVLLVDHPHNSNRHSHSLPLVCSKEEPVRPLVGPTHRLVALGADDEVLAGRASK